MKLEAGKTYVFKDDAARDEYLSKMTYNKFILRDFYNEGFKLEVVSRGEGFCKGYCVIDNEEHHLFKESKPFDISEYEFSDEDISKIRVGDNGDLDLILVSEHINIGEQDAKAIAKHFKLI